MTAETVAATKIGTLTALGTAVLEVSAQQFTIVWPMVSGLVGAGIAWGILRTTVSTLAQQHSDMKADLHAIRESTHATAERVARIEGAMARAVNA